MSAPRRLQVKSVGRRKPKIILLISFDANGLINNVDELAKCALEHRADKIMVQETLLKPKNPKTCKIKTFTQLRMDSIPPLTNTGAIACRLSMTGHGILTLVSVYLPPKIKLLRSDIEVLFALGDAVILFGDLNSRSTH
ncbi:hypothetical protein EVAR_20234_1 [Eumeta japonica]|uniref:RNA-directed DNA polymerase from mobile element jockey n=1 Tax=Eumeta variegata TaxID=151549 RepID=A0A4C1W8J9_EUMVA|nr:hypothetical protein EVAR_20234_1 [Eumeta japonica]